MAMESMEPVAEKLLIITGSMGSGKTTVLAEASDILSEHGIAHAIVDLDTLGTVHLPLGINGDALALCNLRSVWSNYAALGLNKLMVASAIETREELERCRHVVSARKTTVCRLIASIKTMQERVRTREIGILQQQFVDRVAALDAILTRVQLEDFSVVNENRSVTEVAREILTRARWL
jgi:Conserved hypothetical ATP binding protein